jgi:hypothetical protein
MVSGSCLVGRIEPTGVHHPGPTEQLPISGHNAEGRRLVRLAASVAARIRLGPRSIGQLLLWRFLAMPPALLSPRPAQMRQQLISENNGRQQCPNRPSEITQNPVQGHHAIAKEPPQRDKDDSPRDFT